MTLYHSGDDEDEIRVMTDGRRSHLLDVRTGACGVGVESSVHDAFWATTGPALVERFSGIRLDAGLLRCLRYRAGLLVLV